MENASKALIIAGGMMIAMMIIGLITWGYSNIRSYKQVEAEAEEREQIVEFNKQFEAYNKKTVRGYQMISLANLAIDVSTRYTEEEGYRPIEIRAIMSKNVDLPGATNNELISGTKYYDMRKYVTNIYDKLNANQKNQFKQFYFECTDIFYDNDQVLGTGGLGRVIRMVFKQVKVKEST